MARICAVNPIVRRTGVKLPTQKVQLRIRIRIGYTNMHEVILKPTCLNINSKIIIIQCVSLNTYVRQSIINLFMLISILFILHNYTFDTFI